MQQNQFNGAISDVYDEIYEGDVPNHEEMMDRIPY